MSERNEPLLSSTDTEIVKYLLGEMSNEEEAQFETRYFADEELFEQVTFMRGELTDRYVRGQLFPTEHKHFAQQLLTTPEQQEQVAFAQALREVLAEPAPRASVFSWFKRPLLVPAWGLAAAAICSVGLLGGMWSLWRGQQSLNTEVIALRADQAARTERERVLQQQLAALQQPSPTPQASPALPPERVFDESYVAMQLAAPVRSGSGGNIPSEVLPAQTRRLKLTIPLDFAPRLQSLRATLQSADKTVLVKVSRLPFRCNGSCTAVLDATVPRLKPGSYELLLKALDEEDGKPTEAKYLFQLSAPR